MVSSGLRYVANDVRAPGAGVGLEVGDMGGLLITRIGIRSSFLSYQSLQNGGFLRLHHI